MYDTLVEKLLEGGRDGAGVPHIALFEPARPEPLPSRRRANFLGKTARRAHPAAAAAAAAAATASSGGLVNR